MDRRTKAKGKAIVKPNPKRPKMEATSSTSSKPNPKQTKTEATTSSTSAKPEAKEPFLSLPPDVLAKIIAYTPVAQWRSLEVLDKKFRAQTLIAYGQLRNINLERQFSIDRNEKDRSKFGKSVKLIFQKLVKYSPLLTSLNGIDIRLENAASSLGVCQVLAQFENLRSITIGDAKSFNILIGSSPLNAVVEFLRSTKSRSSLKEIRLYHVDERRSRTGIHDEFAAAFVNGREIQGPLLLEKFTFSSCDRAICIRLDKMDTTQLTELDIGGARVEPQVLTNLIERAPDLQRIDFSFLFCPHGRCNGPRLQANKKLLLALGSRENLMSLKITQLGGVDDKQCWNFRAEFIDMLQTIGQRGMLMTLALTAPLNLDEIYATIHEYIPQLQSIRVGVNNIRAESMDIIVSMSELEEMYFIGWDHPLTASIIKKIAQHPCLKRLAFNKYTGEDSLKFLADAPALTELRIRYAEWISAAVYDKWSEKLASNLKVLMLGDIRVRSKDDEDGLVRLLEKAGQLRVLILRGHITEQSLMAISKSCPELEILGVQSDRWNESKAVVGLQEIVDRCPKLRKLSGIEEKIRNQLRIQKYRKIGQVHMEFLLHDFDDTEYNWCD